MLHHPVHSLASEDQDKAGVCGQSRKTGGAKSGPSPLEKRVVDLVDGMLQESVGAGQLTQGAASQETACVQSLF